MASKQKLAVITVVAAAMLFAAKKSAAEDWPTWRHDNARTAATPEQLPAKMVVRWTLAATTAAS